ncbi:MAG: hypothetical protein HY078_05015 [Elusimicrobia bacterium]|nr:hypothetical protein [Elusimicrobiota bacterium]
MKTIPLILLAVLTIMKLNAAALPPAAAHGFAWPAPAGWKTETIPFPLDFAPALKHKGVEELRFMPGFRDLKAEGYWSYAFLWWIEDAPPDAKTLGDELLVYFRGLCDAVGGKKRKFDPTGYKVVLGASGEAKVETYDPFVTGQAITLNARHRTLKCDAEKRNAVLVALSPRPFADPVWKTLDDRLSEFKCHRPENESRQP